MACATKHNFLPRLEVIYFELTLSNIINFPKVMFPFPFCSFQCEELGLLSRSSVITFCTRSALGNASSNKCSWQVSLLPFNSGCGPPLCIQRTDETHPVRAPSFLSHLAYLTSYWIKACNRTGTCGLLYVFKKNDFLLTDIAFILLFRICQQMPNLINK